MQLQYEKENALFAPSPITSALFLDEGVLADSTGAFTFDDIGALNEIEQLSFQAEWLLSDRWSLALLWRRDLERNRDLDQVIGLSYHSCCWNLSIGWNSRVERNNTNTFNTDSLSNTRSTNIRDDSGILLSFELIGLGGIGESPRNLFESR